MVIFIKSIIYDGKVFLKSGNYYSLGRSPNYILLHRYVWQKYNGKIPSGFVIHHIDGNQENNDLSNLQIMTIGEHTRLHAKSRVMSEESKARMSAAKTVNISSEMNEDVVNGMSLAEFISKHGHGRAIWEKIKRNNSLINLGGFKKVTEEMRQDVRDMMTIKEFCQKHDTCSTVMYRIKREEDAFVKRKEVTEEMKQDVINGMSKKKFLNKYKDQVYKTTWVKIRRCNDMWYNIIRKEKKT